MNRRRAILATKKTRLPLLFQEVEYLESNGEQYIDTLLKTNYNYKVSISFLYESNTTGAIFGARIRINEVPWSKNGIIIWTGTNGIRFDFGDYTNNAFIPQNNGIATVVIDKSGGYYNGIKQIDFSNAVFADNTASGNMLLGAIRDTGSVPGIRSPFEGKIYSCKIWNNDELIRDLVPCYRKADNKPGMYDLINNMFYVNANTEATQDYIIGNDIG